MKREIRKGIIYMLCIGMISSILLQKQRCDVFAVTEKIITWEEFRLMFPDERLYHIIDSEVKNQGYVKEGDPYFKVSCLELITELHIPGTSADNTNTEECMDLTGIEHLKKLKKLSIQIEVKSLKPICNLYKLQELTLGDNRTETIKELFRFADLPALWKLDIVSRKDKETLDLSDIKKFENLNELSITVEGDGNAFVNPFVGIDGMPIVPNESNEYAYDSGKNTIILNEEYQELNKQYKISLTTKITDSEGTEREVQLGIYYTYGREPQETTVKQNETEEIKEIKTEINKEGKTGMDKEDETGINEKKKDKDNTDKMIIMAIFAGIILLSIFVCIEVRHHK